MGKAFLVIQEKKDMGIIVDHKLNISHLCDVEAHKKKANAVLGCFTAI